MGLLDTLDNIFFSKKYLDGCKNGNQSSVVKTQSNYSETKEYEEGIFHVKNTLYGDRNSHWNNSEKTVEGKVIEFGKQEFNFDCYYAFYNTAPSIFSKAPGCHEREVPKMGTYFILKTPKGTGQIEIPRQFSDEEIKNLMNQKIKHYFLKENYEETYEGGAGDSESNKYKYQIKVLSGSLKGKIFEESVR